MYRNILVPTDGSKLAAKGIKAGVKLAKALGAEVTGVYVIAPYTPPMYGEAALGGLLLGSETSRVLAHSKVPVLVAR